MPGLLGGRFRAGPTLSTLQDAEGGYRIYSSVLDLKDDDPTIVVAHSLHQDTEALEGAAATFAVIAPLVIALAFLASILFTLLWLGFGGLSLSVFTRITLPPGSHAGLLNPNVGSLTQPARGTPVGAPHGVLAGTHPAPGQGSAGSPRAGWPAGGMRSGRCCERSGGGDGNGSDRGSVMAWSGS